MVRTVQVWCEMSCILVVSLQNLYGLTLVLMWKGCDQVVMLWCRPKWWERLDRARIGVESERGECLH